MTREEFKARVSMALSDMNRETWEEFLESVWQLHLEASNQWIPVEERLPKVGEPVWFYTPSMDEPLKGAYQENGTWYSVEYECKFINGVTHWMEIVPPRKEE